MTDAAIQAAETFQTASLNPNPSPSRDINPSTAASQKQHIPLDGSGSGSSTRPFDAISLSSDIVDPSRVVKSSYSRHGIGGGIGGVGGRGGRPQLPPLPDLRFEQSYLASLKGADTWGRIAWITVRDQVLLPLIQGTLWTLALSGWRYWNRGAQFSGRTLGAKIRRWWWEVNNWKIPQN